MLPHFDTYSDAVRIEREITVRRAERQAPLFEAITRPAPTPARRVHRERSGTARFRAGAIRFLGAILRPAHA
jgi:hypothetical protein